MKGGVSTRHDIMPVDSRISNIGISSALVSHEYFVRSLKSYRWPVIYIYRKKTPFSITVSGP